MDTDIDFLEFVQLKMSLQNRVPARQILSDAAFMFYSGGTTERRLSSCLEEGTSAIGRDYATAVKCLGEVISVVPTSPEPHIFLGIAALAAGELNDSDNYLQHAIELAERVDDAYRGLRALTDSFWILGHVRYSKRDLKDAILAFRRAIATIQSQHSLQQTYIDLWLDLSSALLLGPDGSYSVDEGLHVAETAIELQSEKLEAYFLAGFALLRQERHREAASVLQKGVLLFDAYDGYYSLESECSFRAALANTLFQAAGSERSPFTRWKQRFAAKRHRRRLEALIVRLETGVRGY